MNTHTDTNRISAVPDLEPSSADLDDALISDDEGRVYTRSEVAPAFDGLAGEQENGNVRVESCQIGPVGGHSNRRWCSVHKSYANEPWSADALCPR